jgi:hypothetical protein
LAYLSISYRSSCTQTQRELRVPAYEGRNKRIAERALEEAKMLSSTFEAG